MDLNDLLNDVEGIGTDSFIRSNAAPPRQPAAAVAPVETPPRTAPPPPARIEQLSREIPPAAEPIIPATAEPILPAAVATTAPFPMLDHVLDVEFEVLVELGHTRLPLRDVMRLQPGEAFALDQGSDDLLGLYVHDQLIARGEALVVDGALAVKIVEVLPAASTGC